MNQAKIFFGKGFYRIRNIFKSKIVENLTAGKENLAMSLVDQQNKLKEMAITDVGILSIMEQNIQDYCKELIVMKVDGYERYQELLDTTPTILNVITIQERLSKILKNLQTSTVLGQITPERKDYEEKFSPFFNEIFDKNLDKFPKNSPKRIMLPSAILPYIDKNSSIDIETMKSIKAHTQYKKSQIIEYLRSKFLPILEQKKVEGKVTEQDVSLEDYNNKITLFRKGIEEYKKQPGSRVIRYGDQNNTQDDIIQTTSNNNRTIQSIVLMPPRVNMTYTTQDKPNETQQGDISMNTGFRNISIGV